MTFTFTYLLVYLDHLFKYPTVSCFKVRRHRFRVFCCLVCKRAVRTLRVSGELRNARCSPGEHNVVAAVLYIPLRQSHSILTKLNYTTAQ